MISAYAFECVGIDPVRFIDVAARVAALLATLMAPAASHCTSMCCLRAAPGRTVTVGVQQRTEGSRV